MNATTHNVIRLANGTSINKASQPENPALENIIQKGGTIRVAQIISIISGMPLIIPSGIISSDLLQSAAVRKNDS